MNVRESVCLKCLCERVREMKAVKRLFTSEWGGFCRSTKKPEVAKREFVNMVDRFSGKNLQWSLT